jgi:TolA-binding protein
MSFSQSLIPLAILEIYFWAQDRPGALRRLATAGLLFVCTLGMVAGTFAVTMAIWVPQVRAGFDPRISVAETLSKTISTSGIDQAIQQYHALKTTEPRTYNFDEGQLNSLGYRLIRKKDFKAAIRIFQLNIESFPKSSNAYDSLAEAYMDDGDKPLAIANYQKALELNPNNGNSASMMKKLTVQ